MQPANESTHKHSHDHDHPQQGKKCPKIRLFPKCGLPADLKLLQENQIRLPRAPATRHYRFHQPCPGMHPFSLATTIRLQSRGATLT
jgi:hypothetical protein